MAGKPGVFFYVVNPEKTMCSLSVADRGGCTLQEIADVMGMARERVRQIEEKALAAFRQHVRTEGRRISVDI